jgi:lysophospholipase L1-like esterase
MAGPFRPATVTRRRAGLLGLTVLVLAASVWFAAASTRSRATPLDPAPPRPTATGNSVLLVGDSLLWAATPDVDAALRAEGWEPTIAAAPGTTVASWLPSLPQRVAGTRPDVVVVELGTNDCNGPCSTLPAEIEAFLRALPRDVPILWLDVQTEPSYPAHPETVNRALAAAARHWPAVRIIGMNERFRDRPEWHLPDGLHFNETGSARLADLIAGSLDAVRRPSREGQVARR